MGLMSNPDNLARLRAKVEVYESELLESQNLLRTLPEGRSPFEAILRTMEISQKLLVAYREYCQDLEKLTPR